jgi:hypothetical protein
MTKRPAAPVWTHQKDDRLRAAAGSGESNRLDFEADVSERKSGRQSNSKAWFRLGRPTKTRSMVVRGTTAIG